MENEDKTPYENWTDEKLIEKYNSEFTHKGLVFKIIIVGIIFHLLWVYLKIAFWFTAIFVILLVIQELLKPDILPGANKKTLMEKELTKRGYIKDKRRKRK